MDEQLLSFIAGILRSRAHNARESAGYGGRMDDGGASIMESELRMYSLGFRRELPEEWESYSKEYFKQRKQEEHMKDPEYNEFVRLRNKFKLEDD